MRRIGVGIPARVAAFVDGVLRLSAFVLIYTELGFQQGRATEALLGSLTEEALRRLDVDILPVPRVRVPQKAYSRVSRFGIPGARSRSLKRRPH
jgi:hypothetical protein